MKVSAGKRNTQRRLLDRRVASLDARSAVPPPQGWLRTVRESLGLTAAQLSRRIGIATSTLLEIEERERTGKVMLETVRRVARGMGCDLTYAITPTDADSLEQVVDARARKAAARIMNRTATSMDLEKQSVDAQEMHAQQEDLVRSLKDQLSSALWDEP